MAEQRIIVAIDRDGKIKAETQGFKGAVCLDALQELLGEIDDLESCGKTDEYYQKERVHATTKVIGGQL
ncbi:hypothetical protein FACS1894200_02840 [Spirochaetia bacterium]|nr:hypothetical protein FACS1894200_02840 [Spirochaetia bacterium]